MDLLAIFQALLCKECTTYRLSPQEHQICRDKRHARTRVCSWMYCIVDYLSLDRELVYIAMFYLDRCASKHSFIHQRHTYQLAGQTSLYLAIKVHRNQKCVTLASFVKHSRGLFRREDFINMEKDILHTLGWRMHPPTPQSYLELLVLLLPSGACSPFTRRALLERVKFLVELSVTAQYFFGKEPSRIAVAAFLEVMEHDQGPNVPDQTCRAHFRYCVRSIAGIYCDSREVVEYQDAMSVVHKRALCQLNGKVVGARECVKSPVASEKGVPAVTP